MASRETPELRRVMTTLRPRLAQWRATYGLSHLRVFGSVARGDAAQGSDLDLLATFDHTPTLFELGRLKTEIEALVERRVDLVMEAALRPALMQHVLEDAASV